MRDPPAVTPGSLPPLVRLSPAGMRDPPAVTPGSLPPLVRLSPAGMRDPPAVTPGSLPPLVRLSPAGMRDPPAVTPGSLPPLVRLSPAGMRDPPAVTPGSLPPLVRLCLLFSALLQCVHGELQKSCSGAPAVRLENTCNLPCSCRPYTLLPPPPPPPPPPRLFSPTVAPSSVAPPVKPWGREVEILVLGTVSCASVLFLFLTVIICYKAIKRKPLRKEENGTSRGEYAMSSRCKQTAMETNNTGV